MKRLKLTVLSVCVVLFTLLALTLVHRHGAPFALDRTTHAWSLHHRPDPLRHLARAVTATGTGPVPYLCALAAGFIAGHSQGMRGRLLGAAAALGFLAAGQALRYGVLHVIARPRPPVADWAAPASGYAFPSGHTTTSALAAGLLAWALLRTLRPARARVAVVLLTCWALAVGASRVYLGVHWATDVLGGWLFALTLLALATLLAHRKENAPYPVAPVA
ncbi:phosphatase PAP2 family protein [Streptomyces sp. NBC_01537]|uniref:phosphatase PAP2 family protein n=1 Tax=Streptomyces sp. NBC_01537 TaxID=2903896 RepID=UPI003870D9C8